MRITKAVIPAAGLGTRVLPATKNMPKEMYPIVDKPKKYFKPCKHFFYQTERNERSWTCRSQSKIFCRQ